MWSFRTTILAVVASVVMPILVSAQEIPRTAGTLALPPSEPIQVPVETPLQMMQFPPAQTMQFHPVTDMQLREVPALDTKPSFDGTK